MARNRPSSRASRGPANGSKASRSGGLAASRTRAKARPSSREKPSRERPRQLSKKPRKQSRSIWEEEALPTLFTMPVLCSIIAFILAMTCIQVFHVYTFNLNVEGKEMTTDYEDFNSKIVVNNMTNHEKIKKDQRRAGLGLFQAL